jgi:hypothetical protein
MRSLAFSLAFLSALSLPAQPPKLAPPDPQALENIKQYAAAHFDPQENLSCNEVERPSNSRTITIEMIDPSAPRHGTPTSINTLSLFQNVFGASTGTDFEWDHWGTVRGKKLAAYRYSNRLNGKTHAGLVYADEKTGAISRIIFRGTDTTAHLFCTAQSR